MYYVSKWAKSNTKKARLLMVLGHVVLHLMGILFGLYLFANGFENNTLLIYGLAAMYCLLYALYPNKSDGYCFIKHTYAIQKGFDFLLISLYPVILALGLPNLMNQAFSTASNKASETVLTASCERIFLNSVKISDFPKDWFVLKKQVVKHHLKKLKWQKRERPFREWIGPAFLITIVILIALFLCFGLAALSCTIFCSGYPGWATILFFTGLTGIIFLSIILIRKIIRKMRKSETS